jgi:hypothetical protein
MGHPGRTTSIGMGTKPSLSSFSIKDMLTSGTAFATARESVVEDLWKTRNIVLEKSGWVATGKDSQLHGV